MKKKSILAAALIIGISAMTACSSATEDPANNNSTAGSEQQKSTPAENRQENTKSMNRITSEDSAQAKLIEIYDGREAGETKKLLLSKAERDLVEKEVKAKEAEIKKKNSTGCKNTEFSAGSGIKGSFTKVNSSETAYFYSLCTDGSATSPVGIGGIIIFEADAPTALYTFQTIGFTELKSLPDINKNNLSEFAVITEDGGQGARATYLTILEYKSGDLLRYIGSTKIGSRSLSTTPPMETTSVISVESAANPVFFYDLYVKEDGANNWSLSGKSQKLTLMPEGKSSAAFIKVH